MIGLFSTSLGCPEVLRKNESQGPKKGDFKKWNKAPKDIHPIYKRAKLQHV